MSNYGTEHEYADGLTESDWRALPDSERCECDDCGWRGSADDLNSVHHVHERIAGGEPMADGQCPECAALVRTVETETAMAKDDAAKAVASTMLAALEPLAEYLRNNGGDKEYHDGDGTGWLTRAEAAIAAAKAAGIKGEE